MFLVDFSYFFYFIFIFFILNLVILISALNHFIVAIIFIDLLLLTNILIIVVHSIISKNPLGYNYALIILGIAAADTAVGLGLFILYFKTTGYVSIK